tara:strand:- start:260 stop:2659 length:2400 start_codon:yes stop_codon:yes gene_type:complete
LNRKYHTLNTKYNVLFNGKEALKIGESIIKATLEDDFYDILEIDPILLKGEEFDQTTIVPGFKKAEDNAVKAIQKHSMKFNGLQKNKQIDEAYLLLGKARYYDRRFFPAIEAFNFLLDNNIDESAFIEGRIWREKTNIRLQNNQIAINNLRSLSRNLINTNKSFGIANATVAQAFLNLKKLDSANFYITRAGTYEKNNDLKVRYKYITAQINERIGNLDLALFYYQSIVNMNWKAQRKFWINSKINALRLSNIIYDTDFIEPVKELLDLYENQKFSHTINRSLALYYLNKNIDSLAQDYLSISLNSEGIDTPTKKKNYRDLIDLNLKNQEYVKTGIYLDSLLLVLPNKSIEQKKALREKENLSDILFFENQFRETDSLITLLKFNKEQQLNFFRNFLSKKREIAIKKIQEQETTKKSKSFFLKKNKPGFYFYNPTEVLKGKQIYLSTWGRRPNIDNWRDKTIVRFETFDKNNINSNEYKISEIQVESPEFYVNKLPKKTILDSLIKKNSQAALKLGILYKEKYKAKDLAIKNLKYIVDNKLDTIFLAPALYNLHNIFNPDSLKLANYYKNELIINYPNSTYAQFFIDPDNFDEGEFRTPKSFYLKALLKFKKREYNDAFRTLDKARLLIENTDWEPKAALLRAQIIGRLNGKKRWIQELKNIIVQYPNSNIAQKVNADLELFKLSSDEKTKTVVEFKWVFPFKKNQKFKQKELIDSLKSNIENFKFNNWKITNDTYDSEHKFIVIHGIKSKTRALRIKENLPKTTLKLIDSNNFITLSSQYQKLFIEKAWPEKNYKDYE